MESNEIRTYIESFIPLVKFIASILGPNSEVVLNDVTDLEHSVIHIENANITHRKIGAPASNLALRTIKAGKKENRDFIANYRGWAGNTNLRSSTYFIRYQGQIVAMICVNTDQSSLNNLTKQLELVNQAFNLPTHSLEGYDDPNQSQEPVEHFNQSNDSFLKNVIADKCQELNVSVKYLRKKDKLAIIQILYNDGYFLLKDSVAHVAAELSTSIPTVYRYLNQVKKLDN